MVPRGKVAGLLTAKGMFYLRSFRKTTVDRLNHIGVGMGGLKKTQVPDSSLDILNQTHQTSLVIPKCRRV